jgi:hypothetical protein
MLTHVSAWCDGAIPKVYETLTSTRLSTFSKHMGHCEIVIQDYSGYGDVHTVLLCFDISSPDSFENIEHKVCYQRFSLVEFG